MKVGPFTKTKAFCTVNLKPRNGLNVNVKNGSDVGFPDFVRQERLFPSHTALVPSSLPPQWSLV
jgi:hypothetical protein